MPTVLGGGAKPARTVELSEPIVHLLIIVMNGRSGWQMGSLYLQHLVKPRCKAHGEELNPNIKHFKSICRLQVVAEGEGPFQDTLKMLPAVQGAYHNNLQEQQVFGFGGKSYFSGLRTPL